MIGNLTRLIHTLAICDDHTYCCCGLKENLTASKPSNRSKTLGRNIGCVGTKTTAVYSNCSCNDIFVFFPSLDGWMPAEGFDAFRLFFQCASREHLPYLTHCCNWRTFRYVVPVVFYSNPTGSRTSGYSINVCIVMTWGKVANPARGRLNRESFFFLSPVGPESFVSRDRFCRPVPRHPAHSPHNTQAESGSCSRDTERYR